MALGAELRRLRRERGLSQRAFTRMLGLSAHSNLADYEAGRRIPPRDILRECATILADRDGRLSELHTRALAERAAPPPPQPGSPPDSGRRHRWACGVALVIAVGLLAVLMGGSVERGIAKVGRDAVPALSTWDGNNPKVGDCVEDEVTLASAPVVTAATAVIGAAYVPAGTQVGLVGLRYSANCRAAWPMFEPLLVPVTDQPITVTVMSYRPVDGVRLVFEVPRLEQTYGDLLLTGSGCVEATVVVVFGKVARATGTTGCRRSN